MRRIYFILIFLSCIINNLQAQKVIKGLVVDSVSQNPLFAVTVYLKGDSSVHTITDFDGCFNITMNSNDTIVCSFIGYSTKYTFINLQNDINEVIINMQSKSVDLEEVVIFGKDPISQQFAAEKNTRMDVYLNPNSQGDFLKAITSLASSTTIDESASPSLRGSGASSSTILLNNVPIENPVRFGDLNSQGLFSVFNPEIIDKQYVYSSNPPLIYGNSTAGLVQLHTNSNTDINQVQLSLGLGNLGMLGSYNSKSNKTLIQGYFNHQFSDWFLALNGKSYPQIDYFKSNDFGINFSSKISRQIEFKSYHYYIDEKYLGNQEEYCYNGKISTTNKRYFTVNNVGVKFKKTSIELNNGFDMYNTDYQYGNICSKNFNFKSYTAVDFKFFPNNLLKFQLGFSHVYNNNHLKSNIPEFYYALEPSAPTVSKDISLHSNILETYSYIKYDLANKWSFSAGARFNIPIEDIPFYYSYQLGINFFPNNKNNFIFGIGRYNRNELPTYYTPKYRTITGKQISLDYSFQYKDFNLKSAVYYKTEEGPSYSNSLFNILANKITTYGLELSIEQILYKYYKYSVAFSSVHQNMYVDDYVVNGWSDLNYFLKLCIEYNNPQFINIAISCTARPGLYYHTIVKGKFNHLVNKYEPEVLSLNSSQYHKYNRFDLTISKYIPLKKLSLSTFISVYNLFNNKNQKNVLYSDDYSVRGYDYYQLRSIYGGLILYF